MSPTKKLMQEVADKFNLKMILERSLIQLVKTESHRPSFEITIPEDKYIDSKIINVTEELREKIEKHFLDNGAESISWNNTGSTITIFNFAKPL